MSKNQPSRPDCGGFNKCSNCVSYSVLKICDLLCQCDYGQQRREVFAKFKFLVNLSE